MNGGAGPILIVHPNATEGQAQGDMLRKIGLEALHAENDLDVLRAIHYNPPACIIINSRADLENTRMLVSELKSDTIYGHLPIILVLEEDQVANMDWQQCPADDYLCAPVQPGHLASRVRLTLARSQRDITANPLTGLPGNISIMREAERRLAMKEPFAMAYLDIDHFKAYNDRYGFSRGDEILRMTARVLINAIKESGDRNGYAGHVGGDDYIFITAPEHIERAARQVCNNFDLLAPDFYDPEDRAHGCIASVDRAGNPKSFPFVSCSIAIVDTSISDISHLADISARSAEIKKLAKSIEGSNFIIDRRK